MINNSSHAEASRSPEVVKVLERVQELLDAGKAQEALRILPREDSDWFRNARGVCYLRLGDPGGAVQVLRGLVVTGHLSLKAEAPFVFKTNFAWALLLSGNVSGGLTVLSDIRNPEHPSVRKLHEAVQRWKASMTVWQRISWFLGSEPSCPFAVDFPPGEL